MLHSRRFFLLVTIITELPTDPWLSKQPRVHFRNKGTGVFVSGQSWTCGGGWQAEDPAFPLKRDLMKAPVLNTTFAGGQAPLGAGLRIPRVHAATLSRTSPKGSKECLTEASMSLQTPAPQPCGQRTCVSGGHRNPWQPSWRLPRLWCPGGLAGPGGTGGCIPRSSV